MTARLPNIGKCSSCGKHLSKKAIRGFINHKKFQLDRLSKFIKKIDSQN